MEGGALGGLQLSRAYKHRCRSVRRPSMLICAKNCSCTLFHQWRRATLVLPCYAVTAAAAAAAAAVFAAWSCFQAAGRGFAQLPVYCLPSGLLGAPLAMWSLATAAWRL